MINMNKSINIEAGYEDEDIHIQHIKIKSLNFMNTAKNVQGETI